MGISDDIQTIGSYGATDPPNAVAGAIRLLSIYYEPGTLSEGLDIDWDIIIETYAIYILDRLALQRKAKTDNTIEVPILFPNLIRDMINSLNAESLDEVSVLNAIPEFETDLTWEVSNSRQNL